MKKSQPHPSRGSQCQTPQNSPVHMYAVTSECPRHTDTERLEEPNRSHPIWADCQHRPKPGESWGCLEFLPLKQPSWTLANAWAHGDTADCPTFKSTTLGSKEKASPAWPPTTNFLRHSQLLFHETLPMTMDSVSLPPPIFLSSVLYSGVLCLTCNLVSSSIFYISKAGLSS